MPSLEKRAASAVTGTRHAPGVDLAAVVDQVLEASIVGSFTKVGYLVRRRVSKWAPLPRLEGQVIVVTGASSGIGRATAVELARLGADLWLLGRSQARLEETRRAAVSAGGQGCIELVPLNLVDRDAVSAFASNFLATEKRLDVLVNNAGALFGHYDTHDGVELTVATNVLAPFRLSLLLSPLLRQSGRSVIVTVSSGGMYTQRFDLANLQMSEADYRGVRAYARAKRAQVVLAHEWFSRWGADGVASYSMHPGWVNTPGLGESLPAVARLGPLLRTPAEGADTVVWLAPDGPRRESPEASGVAPEGFFLDRQRRGEYYVPGTRRSPAQRVLDGWALWRWCEHESGLSDVAP
jgi:dehydrogenase/reductase SDR family protein 12